MTEKKNEEIAVFRFGVIQEFVGGAMLSPDEKRKLIREKCDRKWVIPYSNRTRISENTIYRWIRRYSASGGDIESLCSATQYLINLITISNQKKVVSEGKMCRILNVNRL